VDEIYFPLFFVFFLMVLVSIHYYFYPAGLRIARILEAGGSELADNLNDWGAD
jgi:hypothetical protein